MTRKNISLAVVIGAFVSLVGLAATGSGCKSEAKQDANQVAAGKPQEKHEAHHGGCLNAIETCAVGHAEVKLDGNVLKVWFVGGETETDKAVRVSDKQIVLSVSLDRGQERTIPSQANLLTLEPKPSALAEEKVGDCSYFEGQADWLAGAKKFQATGKVSFKGKERPIKIEFPEGYDPD